MHPDEPFTPEPPRRVAAPANPGGARSEYHGGAISECYSHGDAHIPAVRIPQPLEAQMAQALRPLTPYLSGDGFIGARLRAHRLACGLSQAALGRGGPLGGSAVHLIV